MLFGLEENLAAIDWAAVIVAICGSFVIPRTYVLLSQRIRKLNIRVSRLEAKGGEGRKAPRPPTAPPQRPPP